MPYVERPDGATIYYEVHGSGFPLLLFAPGGVNSQIDMWTNVSPIHAVEAFSDEWMVIAMDQRNAGRSFGPLAPVSYEITAADQRAVLDAVGVDRCLLMGGCIGVAFVLRFIMEAPGRVTGAVCQKPVGLDETNSMATFTAMFGPTVELANTSGLAAVIESAAENPVFNRNNAGGPWALRLANDPGFRPQFMAQTPESYVGLIDAYSEGVWPSGNTYFGVPDSWLKSCDVPLLVLPGSDDFHPTGAARALAGIVQSAECLEPDWPAPSVLPGTIETVRNFLRRHTPKP